MKMINIVDEVYMYNRLAIKRLSDVDPDVISNCYL